jgi:uncharacterized protein (TIGR02646 family)
MIKVNRGSQPPNFEQHKNKWRMDFDTAQIKNREVTISAFWAKVRRSISEEAQYLFQAFHNKCAFCESYLGHVTSPNIEHYRPKSKFPELAFEWENWLLSCGRCNDKKWAHFPQCDDDPCLIDPTKENPELHLEFVGYMPVSRTERAAETIRLVGLDRNPLEEERSRWLTYLNSLLLHCVSSKPEIKKEARELLIWAMQDDAPYTNMTRCYLRQKAPRLAAPSVPHPYVSISDPMQRIQCLVNEWVSPQDLT